MEDFISGQRRFSDAELQLGLRTILTVEHRTVTVVFPARGETRTHAKQSASLSRFAFGAGDTVRAAKVWGLHIEQILESKPWIGKIQKLLEEKKPDEVKKELQAFRKRYPDYKLPDDLKSLIPDD